MLAVAWEASRGNSRSSANSAYGMPVCPGSLAPIWAQLLHRAQLLRKEGSVEAAGGIPASGGVAAVAEIGMPGMGSPVYPGSPVPIRTQLLLQVVKRQRGEAALPTWLEQHLPH